MAKRRDVQLSIWVSCPASDSIGDVIVAVTKALLEGKINFHPENIKVLDHVEYEVEDDGS